MVLFRVKVVNACVGFAHEALRNKCAMVMTATPMLDSTSIANSFLCCELFPPLRIVSSAFTHFPFFLASSRFFHNVSPTFRWFSEDSPMTVAYMGDAHRRGWKSSEDVSGMILNMPWLVRLRLTFRSRERTA